MMPNYQPGENVLIQRYFMSSPNPLRGEVVLYRTNESSSEKIGRVLALPGEAVRIENGSIYIDKGPEYRLEEEYLPTDVKTTSVTEGWFELNEYQYFIVLDSRVSPIDISRSIVGRGLILGKAIQI